MGNVSVTFDHRVIDGKRAADFGLAVIARLAELDRRGFGLAEVRLEHRLDPRRGRAAVEPRDDTLFRPRARATAPGSTWNRSASSGRSSTSTLVTRRRPRSFRAMWASRLSIRRAGPERREVKKTRSGRLSVTDGLLAGSLDEQRRRGTARLRFPRGLLVLDRRERGARRGGRRPVRRDRRRGARERGSSPIAAGRRRRAPASASGSTSWQSGGWGDRRRRNRRRRSPERSARRQIVRGALRRGGTRVGTGGARRLRARSCVAALAWIPAAGYLEALVLPALGAAAAGGRGPSATQVCGRSPATSRACAAEEARARSSSTG